MILCAFLEHCYCPVLGVFTVEIFQPSQSALLFPFYRWQGKEPLEVTWLPCEWGHSQLIFSNSAGWPFVQQPRSAKLPVSECLQHTHLWCMFKPSPVGSHSASLQVGPWSLPLVLKDSHAVLTPPQIPRGNPPVRREAGQAVAPRLLS